MQVDLLSMKIKFHVSRRKAILLLVFSYFILLETNIGFLFMLINVTHWSFKQYNHENKSKARIK